MCRHAIDCSMHLVLTSLLPQLNRLDAYYNPGQAPHIHYLVRKESMSTRGTTKISVAHFYDLIFWHNWYHNLYKDVLHKNIMWSSQIEPNPTYVYQLTLSSCGSAARTACKYLEELQPVCDGAYGYMDEWLMRRCDV